MIFEDPFADFFTDCRFMVRDAHMLVKLGGQSFYIVVSRCPWFELGGWVKRVSEEQGYTLGICIYISVKSDKTDRYGRAKWLGILDNIISNGGQSLINDGSRDGAFLITKR